MAIKQKQGFTQYAFPLFVVFLVIMIALPFFQGKSPFKLGLDISGGVIVTYRPDFSKRVRAYRGKTREEILKTCKEIIANRLTRKLKTIPDVNINNEGEGKLIVSIPDVENSEEVLRIVGKTYNLTFRLARRVDSEDVNSREGREVYEYGGVYYELEEARFSGDMIDPVSIEVTRPDPQDPSPNVTFAFLPEYVDHFRRFSLAHKGEDMAVLLDDDIEIVATIKNEITGGQVAISGNYTQKTAEDNAILLRSGSLPISLIMESLQEVGPSLGQSVQEKGILAGFASLLMLIVILIIAYLHRSWFLIAGVLSLGFLFFAMTGLIATFKLTLDFAAIAGLILSIGMGMDAFIIIFESSELQLKKFRRHEIPQFFEIIIKEIYSFHREGRILLHSIMTTLIVVSFLFFSDRVKYFALFMIIGLFASFLTILFTRWLLLRTYGLAADLGISPLGWLRSNNLQVFRFRKFYNYIVIAAIGFASFLLISSLLGKDYLEFGSDFKPGTQITVETSDRTNLENLKDDFENEFQDIRLKYQALNQNSQSETFQYLVSISVPIESTTSTNEDDNTPRESSSNTDESSVPPTDSIITDTEPQQTDSPNEGLPLMKEKKEKIFLTSSALISLLQANDIDVLGLSSIDSKVSSERFLRSLSILALSFVLLAVYLFFFQGPLDDYFFRKIEKSENRGLESRLPVTLGILIALLHDLSFVFITCFVFNIDIDLVIIAGILTVIGYSVNDSIVVWGQIQKYAVLQSPDSQQGPERIVTTGIDKIISRAVLTTLSTIVPAVAILIFGITDLEPFAWVIIIGTIAGTFSSIFIVGTFALKALQPKASPSPPEESEEEGPDDEANREDILNRMRDE